MRDAAAPRTRGWRAETPTLKVAARRMVAVATPVGPAVAAIAVTGGRTLVAQAWPAAVPEDNPGMAAASKVGPVG